MAIRSWLPVLAVRGGILVALALTNVPGGRTVLRFVPPVAVAILGGLCFGDIARRDRMAFMSIVGPAFIVAVASSVVVGPWRGYLALLAIGFLALFVFAPDRTWPWWWRHVLRRPMPSAAQRFNQRLAVELTAWGNAFLGPDFGAEYLAAAEQAIARVRTLQPPDGDWSALRDDYVEVAERWTRRIANAETVEVGGDLQKELVDLEARRQDLTDQA